MPEEMIKTAPVVLFCYNREDVLRSTIAALRLNELASESDLFVFSDGPRDERDVKGVRAVRDYLPMIQGFRSVTIREAAVNQGLARSVIAGVSEIVNRFGRVIVLEDDLVTSPCFLRFMNNALDFYENNELVAGIHGYLPPTDYPTPETFFTREVGCWGWATWKRGWALFEPDTARLLKQFRNRKMRFDFDLGNSYPYYQMLCDQAAGKIDSWAIRWYASVFLKEKLGLQPGRNLVSNIGYSGGTHYANSELVSESVTNELPRVGAIPVEVNREMIINVYMPHKRSLYVRPAWHVGISGPILDFIKTCMRKFK